MSLADRLKRFSKADASGCHLWISTISKRTGYAQISWKGGNRSAHRMAWVSARGPIPKGMQVCHRCDVRHCINVDHLFLGTHKDNMADKTMKGRAPSGSRNGNSKLSDDQILAIRAAPTGYGTGLPLAKQYGVTAAAISYVRRKSTR
jgi:hypothetical protein